MLDPEQRHPEDEGDEKREARIHERSRAEIGVHADPEEELSRKHGDDDADRGAEHPRGKERADDVDLWSHDVPLYRPGAELASGASPVVNASAAVESSSWTFVSSSTNRARLNSRRAARSSVSVPSPRRYDASESS